VRDTAERCVPKGNVVRLGVGFRDTGYFFDTDGLDPFCCDNIAFSHRHSRIPVKHLRASAATPGEELEKMISTHGLCTGRGIGFGLAIGNTAVDVLHERTLLKSYSMPVVIRDFQALREAAICDGFSSMIGGCS